MRAEALSSERSGAALERSVQRTRSESADALRLRELLSSGSSSARAQRGASRLIREFAADLEANTDFLSLLQGAVSRSLLEDSLEAMLPDILAGCCDSRSSALLTALGVHELLHFRAIVTMRWRLMCVLGQNREVGVLPEAIVGGGQPIATGIVGVAPGANSADDSDDSAARIAGIVGLLNRAATGEHVLGELLDGLCRETGFGAAVIERVDSRTGRSCMVAHAGLSEDESRMLQALESRDSTLFGIPLGEAVTLTGPPGVDDDTRLRLESVRVLAGEVLCCTPIRAGARVLGTLSLVHRHGSLAPRSSRRELQSIADHLGVVWELGRLRSNDGARRDALVRQSGVLALEVRDALRSLERDASAIRDQLASTSERQRRELRPRVMVFEHETRRVASLADHALALSQCGALERQRWSLRRLVEEVLRSQWPKLAEAGIELDLDLELGGLELEVDAGKLARALRSLVQNAIEAMLGSRTRCLLVRARLLDDGVEIRVRDSGPGFADPNRAFEFFYSSKPYGTGLGLSVAREIARAHLGNLEVAEDSPLGAELLLTLPIAP